VTSTPQQTVSSIRAKIRSLPIKSWPEADRKAWTSACQPSQRLKRGGAGCHMKAITLNDLARRYGYFLDFMNRQGRLNPDKAAGAHVTPDNVDAYLTELSDRVGSVTVQGSIYINCAAPANSSIPPVIFPGSPTLKMISPWRCGHVQSPTDGS
jgi:hypothetical protein